MQDDITMETQNPSHNSHDKGYKQLLSNKQTFLSLLRSFIHEDWVNDIRESDLVRVEKSYILQDFSNKEADVVYQLQTESGNVIFYCLIELQSAVDYAMPYRLLLYMTEIWRDTFHNTPPKERKRKQYHLPAVIPVVLYNGKYNWTAPLQFKEMIANYQRFGNHIVNFNYILLDINRYDEQELYNMANLLSSVFIIDRTAKQTADVVEKLRKLLGSLQLLKPEQFKQFTVWLTHVMLPKLSPEQHPEIIAILQNAHTEEVAKMISNVERVMEKDRRRFILEGKLEGKLEGRQEGIQEGRQEGELKSRQDIARKLLLRGYARADIVELTELSAEEIERLAKSMQ